MSAEEVKRRIASVSETRQITKAMELISVSKMRKALRKYESNLAYFGKVRATIKDILAHSEGVTHRYLTHRPGTRTAYLVIAGNKGLAGGYNAEVLELAGRHMSDRPDRYLFTAGAIAEEYFVRRGERIDVAYTDAAQNPTLHDARGIARDILGLYERNLLDEVYVVYTRMISAAEHRARAVKLLPVETDDFDDVEQEAEYRGALHYDPSPKAVLNILVPQYIVGLVFAALVQSAASEHCARMTAMSAANANADKMLGALKLEYNRARQENVTAEMLDMIGSRLQEA